jgi:2-polyprenyl-3-methyl-5-hydroxy-6-metoxy-1,4-benzoquinol methylase
MDCEHGFLNPQPSWEELAPYYGAGYHAYDPTHGAADQDDDQLVNDARKRGEFRRIPIRPGSRVLDVGCGGGMFLRIRKRLGDEVQGVEPSPIGAERARAAGLPVFLGTVEQFAAQHPDRKYDIITANHVLEHVPQPVATLEVLRQLLVPGGYLWIAVPNAACVFCQSLRDVWHSTDLPFHLMQFTPRSLQVAGERAGLVVRSLSTDSMPSAVGASIRQWLRRRYKVPQRLTLRIGLIDTIVAPRVGRRLDASSQGEAIMVEFVARRG